MLWLSFFLTIASMFFNFTTDRLNIRPLVLSDKQMVFELLNSQSWIKYIGDRNIKSLEDSESYIKTIIENKNYHYHVIELMPEQIPIGIITFLYRNRQDFPDLGFAILPDYEGRGYAYEACKGYIDKLIINNVSNKILGITLVDNEKSIKLLEKLGFKFAYIKHDNQKQLSVYELNAS